jgi:hypothetical protein
VLQSIHFCCAEIVQPSIAPCAHCDCPLHPIPDQPAGQTHCNSANILLNPPFLVRPFFSRRSSSASWRS